jgi:hypothetical protein
MSNQFVKIGSDGKPLKPDHPVIETGELAGSLDYDVDNNRWNINYFGLNRLRLLALFGTREITPAEMSEFWANLEMSRNGQDFGDSSDAEVNDRNVIKALSLNTKFNAYLNGAAERIEDHKGVKWMKPFVNLNGHATRIEAGIFARSVEFALEQISKEMVQVLSEEQYQYYSNFVSWAYDGNYDAMGFNL